MRGGGLVLIFLCIVSLAFNRFDQISHTHIYNFSHLPLFRSRLRLRAGAGFWPRFASDGPGTPNLRQIDFPDQLCAETRIKFRQCNLFGCRARLLWKHAPTRAARWKHWLKSIALKLISARAELFMRWLFVTDFLGAGGCHQLVEAREKLKCERALSIHLNEV